MPLYFNLAEKLFMKRLNIGPAPVADLAGGFSFFAIDAALRINLFEVLAGKSSSAEELALLCSCEKEGLVTLLDLLETLGYVKERRKRYSITGMTKKWLLDSSVISFKEGFEYYSSTLTEIWPYLADSLKMGTPHINFYQWLKGRTETAEVYQRYMMSLAEMVIPELVSKISLCKSSVLDVGGSHGLYSIALCKKYPEINVNIIDSSYAMPLLEKNIKSAQLEHRISPVTGDILTYNFDRKFDTVLLFNVCHEHDEDYNKQLIARIAELLKPDGRLVILESMKKKGFSPFVDYMTRIYGLMFFHFLGGRNYTFDEISTWLYTSGFSKIKSKSLYRSGFTLVNAYFHEG